MFLIRDSGVEIIRSTTEETSSVWFETFELISLNGLYHPAP